MVRISAPCLEVFLQIAVVVNGVDDGHPDGHLPGVAAFEFQLAQEIVPQRLAAGVGEIPVFREIPA